MANIIVVDDEPDITDLLEMMLTLRGWTVKRALNRRAALQMIREDPEIHMVLLDYNMPGMRAEDFLDQIRHLTPKPKVLLFTAAHRVEDRARQLGVEHYLSKPFDADDIYNKISECLSCSKCG
jgi:CheY-like chemotaxis protein